MITEVARREIVTRARSKAYRVTTGVLVVATLLLIAGAAFFGSDDDGPDTSDLDIALDQPIEGFDEMLGRLTPETVDVGTRIGTRDEIDALVEGGDVDVAIADGSTLVWADEIDAPTQALVLEALTRLAIEERATDLGIDASTLDRLLEPVTADDRVLDPTTDGDAARTVVATLGIFVMFFAIQMYGSQIALVVVEEKAHRIIEILLALVRPRDLLAGKVLGVGILAALQVVIPVVGLFVALAVSGTTDIPLSTYASLPLLLVTFGLGFTMYGTMFALVGSLVSRQEDTQQALFPVFIPIITGYVLALQAVASPESSLARVASIVPFTSPFALPVTVAQGTIGVPGIALALGLLALTAAVFLALAARIYEFTLLRSGSRVTLGEALRLARR